MPAHYHFWFTTPLPAPSETITCGGSSSTNVTILRSPGYPSTYSDAQTCTMKVLRGHSDKLIIQNISISQIHYLLSRQQ